MTDPSVRLARLRLENNPKKNHFKIVRSLGSGAFGCVDLCTVKKKKSYAKKGEQVAVKRIKTVFNTEMAKKEALVLSKLNHPFIVRYLDNFKDKLGQLCIVIEYCDQGTLEDYLSSSVRPHPECWIWRLVGQFSCALDFLHSQRPPILHNDLKPANILCRNEPEKYTSGSVSNKIADFGVCNILGRTPSAMYYCASQVGGTICYLAPEVLKGDDPHITTSADMWSLGAVLTYIANDRQHLFRSAMEVTGWIGDSSPIGREFKYPELHQLVLSLLSVDKHSRPTASKVWQDLHEIPERQAL